MPNLLSFLVVIKSMAKKCSNKSTPFFAILASRASSIALPVTSLTCSTRRYYVHPPYRVKSVHLLNWKTPHPCESGPEFVLAHLSKSSCTTMGSHNPSPASKVSCTCLSRSSPDDVTAAMPPGIICVRLCFIFLCKDRDPVPGFRHL